ncbi:MAG: hypothetical protein ACYDAN_10895 [Candidatus Limnocylindrales bacterium]
MRWPQVLLGLGLAAGCTLLAAPAALAFGSNVDVALQTWHGDSGHGYVGVQVNGHWAPPQQQGKPVKTEFWSEWVGQGNPSPYCHAYWVIVHRTSDGTPVNAASPEATTVCGPQSAIGVDAGGYADMSLYLDVAVDPVTAPARTDRSVTAQLTAGWQTYLGKAISAYVIPSSVREARWTVDFGDGSSRVFPDNGTDSLTTAHAYEPGTFDVTVTVHVTGQAYGAFFTPAGDPVEQVVPFAIDITNSASGVSALPVDYIAPVVTVGASPSGTLPGRSAVPPDAIGHDALWWPRGLHCALYVRPVIVIEGVMRSGGVVIGGGSTVLLSYRYERGANDASDATRTGSYAPGAPIAIQWDAPGTYPVHLVLALRTTYVDGTVRDTTAAGDVPVTVVYAAVTH